MQILILYHSGTGTTQRMAEEIAKGAQKTPGTSCLVKSTEAVSENDFISSDAVIAGSPAYLGSMAAELKSVFDNFIHLRSKMKNKVGAAFSAAAGPGGGAETTLLSIIQALLIYGMIIVGNPGQTAGNYGVAWVGTPDEKELEQAHNFGEEVSLIVKKQCS